MNAPLHRDFRAYLDRIRSQATNTFDLGQIAKWIERNTTDPLDPARLWSFKMCIRDRRRSAGAFPMSQYPSKSVATVVMLYRCV